MVAERSIDADKVVDVPDAIIAGQARQPALLWCDNGAGDHLSRVAGLVPLQPDRGGIHRAWLTAGDPFVESFNSRVRDELLTVESFSCLTEAKVMVEDFRLGYNACRPHRAHGMMTPTAFATGWRTGHEPRSPALAVHRPAASVRPTQAAALR